MMAPLLFLLALTRDPAMLDELAELLEWFEAVGRA